MTTRNLKQIVIDYRMNYKTQMLIKAALCNYCVNLTQSHMKLCVYRKILCVTWRTVFLFCAFWPKFCASNTLWRRLTETLLSGRHCDYSNSTNDIASAFVCLGFCSYSYVYYNKNSGQLTIADRCALIFKVTQGHLFNRKTYIHDFLLVINWDLSSISQSHRLQDMVPRSWKPPHPILKPQIKGPPWIS